MLSSRNNLTVRFRLAILLSVIIFMFSGCNTTTSADYNTSRINAILYNIRMAFNAHDINAIMSYIHTDFVHKGQSRWAIREVWLDRMSTYQLLDFHNVTITVVGNSARVEFTMKLQSAHQTVYTSEPNQNGDLSFFIYDNHDWFVYGNQLYF